MNPEQIRDLRACAAKHAALADPVRLHVVDLLAGGDLSSTELQNVLGISSNLLAHHLRVLEDQSIVVRSRSQGDRRRSYVHLQPGVLRFSSPIPPKNAQRLVFVCTANSVRSQLAGALWQQASRIPATSAGTHPANRVDPRAIQAAGRHHLEFADGIPRSINDVVGAEDVIITVCDAAHEELGPASEIHWSVPDPVLIGTAAAFDAAYDDLASRVRELAPRLRAA